MKKQKRKPSIISYTFTYEVLTAYGNAVWHTSIVYGLGKLDMLALCKLYGYKIIDIRKSKAY